MNKFMRLALLPAFLFAALLLVHQPSSAQILGTKYLWAQTSAVTTTKIDCTYTNEWEEAAFYFYGCDGYFKISGKADTTNFSSRPWIFVYEGQAVTTGPADKLKRLWLKSSSGTGTVYIMGYKKVAQF